MQAAPATIHRAPHGSQERPASDSLRLPATEPPYYLPVGDEVALFEAAYADGTGGVPHGARTYSGTKTRWGVVAVDPKVIPIGSTLQIEGYEGVTFVAEDIGGAIKGESLDIWLPNSKDARAYGTQYRKVTVLREGAAR